MKTEISFAKLKDAKNLEILDNIANGEFNYWFPKSKKEFEKIIIKSKRLILVSKNDDDIVGYLQAKFKDDKKTIWVENIYVMKKFRKNKISKNLVRKFVEYWKNKVENIVLLTSDKNKIIFEKLGFKKTMNYMEFVYRNKIFR